MLSEFLAKTTVGETLDATDALVTFTLVPLYLACSRVAMRSELSEF